MYQLPDAVKTEVNGSVRIRNITTSLEIEGLTRVVCFISTLSTPSRLADACRFVRAALARITNMLAKGTMHNLAVRQGEADRFPQIAHMAKVRHAGFERKLMDDALASHGKVHYLVRDSDAILIQNDAAHESHPPPCR